MTPAQAFRITPPAAKTFVRCPLCQRLMLRSEQKCPMCGGPASTERGGSFPTAEELREELEIERAREASEHEYSDGELAARWPGRY